jgi:hypothetical protein
MQLASFFRKLTIKVILIGTAVSEAAVVGLFYWFLPEEGVMIVKTRSAVLLAIGTLLLFVGGILSLVQLYYRTRITRKFGLAFDENMEPVCPKDFAPLSFAPGMSDGMMRCPICKASFVPHNEGTQIFVRDAIRLGPVNTN